MSLCPPLLQPSSSIYARRAAQPGAPVSAPALHTTRLSGVTAPQGVPTPLHTSGRSLPRPRCAPAQPRPPALGPQQASLHAVPQPLRRTWTRKYSLFTRNLSAAGVQELTWQPRAGHRLGSREGGAVSQSSTELQTQSSRPRAGVGAQLHPAPASHSAPRWPVIRKSRVRRVRSPLPWKQSQDRRRSEAPDGRKARLPTR